MNGEMCVHISLPSPSFPAKAGIHWLRAKMDSRVRGNDGQVAVLPFLPLGGRHKVTVIADPLSVLGVLEPD